MLCKVWRVRSQVRCPKAAFAGHRPLRYDLTHSHRALPLLDEQPITRYLAHADARALLSSTQLATSYFIAPKLPVITTDQTTTSSWSWRQGATRGEEDIV